MSDRLSWIRHRRRLWGGLLLTGIIAFCVVYGLGIVAGGQLAPMRSDEICNLLRVPTAAPDERFGSYRKDFFPLSSRCTALDGHSFELVPSFVNPTLAIVTTLCTVLAVLWLAALWQTHRWQRSFED